MTTVYVYTGIQQYFETFIHSMLCDAVASISGKYSYRYHHGSDRKYSQTRTDGADTFYQRQSGRHSERKPTSKGTYT